MICCAVKEYSKRNRRKICTQQASYLLTEAREIEEENPQDVINYVGKASGAPVIWQRQAEHYLHLVGARDAHQALAQGEEGRAYLSPFLISFW